MEEKERIAAVRTWLADELSQRIFDMRVKNADNDTKWIFQDIIEAVELNPMKQQAMLESTERLMKKLRDPAQKTFLYGAGGGCRSILCAKPGKVLGLQGIVGIIDNYVTGERYGYPVISFREFLEKHRDAVVLNTIGTPAGEQAHQQCLDAGIEVMSYYQYDRIWDQYFDLPAEFGLVQEGEVFVQAGCYNGDTQKSYKKWFGQTYEKMVTFEPHNAQYQVCKNALRSLPNVELVKAGLLDHSGTAKLDLKKPGSSCISETGTEEIETVSLDDYIKGGRVTFIALDIEGGEFKALQGAEKIIRTQKPKLAICAYHKPEDIYELPELVKSLRPDYKLYLRHYHLLDLDETVLYAL